MNLELPKFGTKMNRLIHLSKRESEIAEMLSWGADKKWIANRLFISIRTVDNTTRNVYEKIGINKVNELAAWWFCTHFGISFDLSPLVRRTIATCLLSVFLYGEFAEHIDLFRRGRNRTEESRTARRNRRVDDDAEPFIFELIEPLES